MTDQELIRVLRHCGKFEETTACEECPADGQGCAGAFLLASDRLEELAEENERLTKQLILRNHELLELRLSVAESPTGQKGQSMAEITTLQKCWYQYYTGEKARRKHLEIKLVCTECHYVWDRQRYAFSYCPGCGRRVSEIEEVKNDG